MRVVREVPEDLLRPAEGPLGVDHPVPGPGGGKRGVELAGIGEVGEGAVELQVPPAVGAGELLEEEAAEQAAEDLDGGEEGGAPRLPLATVYVEARVGHDHVQVRVEAELLIPGMEDRGAADAHAAVAGIGGDGAQGLGDGPEEDVEHHPAVRACRRQWRQPPWAG